MVVEVRGADSVDDAKRAARAVTASPLWQCALAGGDPNWGRIFAALGASGAEMNPDRLDIALDDLQIVSGGVATSYDQAEAKGIMAKNEVAVRVDLHQGDFAATAWGCDLTHGYIDENTTYTR
jgi:glutamate N-acetyltransferase/amino-acid N-acetyltransferase